MQGQACGILRDVYKMSDGEIIFTMEQICFPGDYWSLDSVLSQLARPNVIYSLIKSEKGEYAGYILGSIVADEAEIYRVGVLPQFRRQALGKRLMEAFISLCKGKAERIFLEVRSKNSGAIALYKCFCFEQIAVRKNYYNDDDAVIYRLEME